MVDKLKHSLTLILRESNSQEEVIDEIFDSGNSAISYFLNSFSESLSNRSLKDFDAKRFSLATSLEQSSKRFYAASKSFPSVSTFPLKKLTSYSGTLDDLANEVEALRYDVTLNFMKQFENSFEQYISDIENSPSSNKDVISIKDELFILRNSLCYVSRGNDHLNSVWEICKPKMKESLKVFPEIIYDVKK